MMKHLYLALTVLLLLCLAPMPYGYFMLVRFVMMVACGWLAYRYYTMNKVPATWVFGVLALLFQPIYKIALGRTVWNVIDVIVALLMIALFVMELRREKRNKVEYKVLPPTDNPEVESNKFDFQLEGKLGPNELIYVASEEDKELTELFEKSPKVLEGWGKMIGFHVIYLPLLIKHLKEKKVLQYRAPYLKDAEIKNVNIGNDFILQYLDNPADRGKMKHGFLRTENIHRGSDGKELAVNRFYPLSSKSGEPIADQLHQIGKQIASERGANDFRLEGDFEQYNIRLPKASSIELAEREFRSQLDHESIDDLLEEVRDKIAKLRQYGIAEYILEQLIHPDDRLSRLAITKDYRILLPDYNDMEIKMEPLVKAVYLLFLKHPEGILFKHLPDYREELIGIYAKLRPLGMSERAVQSIEDVTNPLLNSINEKCTRIRSAFVGQFDDRMAKHYYIDGPRGEAKNVALPRDLVVWE